ncbi:DUF5954 family protein [Streptomyces sp. H27-C3]|uniref:DUF5954 family protein n=1 Tax=Streptomyces sp. H27-C3 TaxID=3046305 RepID=UPI0024BAE2AF|nr:DUF5954 family protein [Streptomyces sp. H27-C3]MDJ0462733.1 DUF5954 family protein [Streptomyces sp. H27-C3]
MSRPRRNDGRHVHPYHSDRYPYVWPRGAVFGVAALGPEPDAQWQLVEEVTERAPQDARDNLNSLLWFKAKDEAETPAERRELLAAVGILERERIDELTVLGIRYRIVRGDEYARCGQESGPEPPRPTDHEPTDCSWECAPGHDTALPDPGYVLDPGRTLGLMAEASRLGLQDFSYEGDHIPPAMREESRQAVHDHPELILLPVGFGLVERAGKGWRPRSRIQPTPHDARRVLFDGLATVWPRVYELDTATTKAYARAAEHLKAAPRSNEITVRGKTFRLCRVERMLRTGPDGPEPPRLSDPETTEPMRIRPRLDDQGVIRTGPDDAEVAARLQGR